MADIILTQDEAEALLDWLEIHFIDDIRKDDNVDSMEWLHNMMVIWRKCSDAERQEKHG